MNCIKALLFLLIAGGLAAPAQAASTARTDQAEVRLIAASADVRAATPVDLGVEFRLAPGWHIYAKNPGDAGLPTEVAWVLPPGASVGDLAYPPHRRFDEAGLSTYGYSGSALFTARAVPAAAPFAVRARVSWLACKEICVPGAADLTLALPAAAGAPTPSAEAALFSLAAPPAPAPPPAAPALGAVAALGLALLGGLLLNLMPCVFPVLALKVLHVAHLAAAPAGRAAARRDGALYAAGAILGFAALGGLLAALAAGGAAVGWGFQLQSPAVVLVLAVLMLLVGLDLSGILPMGGLPAAAQARLPAARGPFATGLLAVAVASPCTAPFMGAALGFAAVQTPLLGFAVFPALGIGFALPFAALGWAPGLARLLPKPGAWMERLRRILAWPMFAAAAWLAWVLAQQTAMEGLTAAALVVLAVILAIAMPKARRVAAPVVAALLVYAAVTVERHPAAQAAAADAYSATRLAALRAENRPVFVDFTAAWCLTCQVNKRTTLADAAVLKAFKDKNVARLTADWTQRDPDIGKALAALGRNGVPAYALYAPGRATPTLLPELLTPGTVLDALAPLPPK
ncbi:protein-disulfide reductase DsbD family protein [Oleispirillum naphthae]|uniref:protein-disulfide reductase DsbD family protein n=1 Tax=Oleispirillum naphthae TaxID=2838853 RepID=UPI003082207B